MHSEKMIAMVVQALLDMPGMRALGACALILVSKMLLLGYYTSAVRGRLGITTNTEDGHGRLQVSEIVPPEVTRAKRVHQNDLENTPPFLFVTLLAVLTGAPGWAVTTVCVICTMARIAHSVFYLRAMQPYRTIAHVFSVVAIVGSMLMVFIQIVQRT